MEKYQHLMDQLQNATSLTTSFADAIKPGIYAIAIADGTHTMTLTYDGSTYSLLDQQTGWNGDFSSASTLDAHLVQTTRDMLNVRNVKPFYKAYMKSNKLNFE